MEKEDARKLEKGALYEKRKQVIRLHRNGERRSDIARVVALSHTAVSKIVKLFETGGMAALKLKRRGRSYGQVRRLTAEQEMRIQSLIIDNRPEQIKMDFALWSRAAVSQLIERESGLMLPVRTVGDYLKRWGFTPQKPIKKAYEQRPEAVKKWLDEEYPEITKRAYAQGGEIHWGDETALVNTDVRGRGFSPKGQTPVVYAPGTRQRLSMIATVTNKGQARWQIIDGNFNADRLIEFLDVLIKDAGRKVFLILDNLRVHHSKPVKAWLAENKEKIECFYLPSYSPELNPEERLNADIKQAMRKKVPVRSKEKLRVAVTEHMESLVKQPERITKFFGDPRVKYAA